MQIGEFALLCETKVSVLRHYDKEGLLCPDYIDRFTGYRYYSEEQADTFFEITALKGAGFSLTEIKEILSEKRSDEDLCELFDKKKRLLSDTLTNLREAKQRLLGDTRPENIEFTKTNDGYLIKLKCTEPSDLDDAYETLDRTLLAMGYQRTSFFKTLRDGADIYTVCDGVKLRDRIGTVNETEEISFCDDPSVVGKWQVMGEYAVIEDFFFRKNNRIKSTYKALPVICFLPEGKEYWCYSWSRGKLIIRSSMGNRSINDYTISEYDGQRYMLVDLKSYNYRRGGKTTVLVMRQLDNASYEKEELARHDNIDLPFVLDPDVVGTWRSCGFVYNKKNFSPEVSSVSGLFWQKLKLSENGEAVSTFSTGETVSSRDMQEWTKGYIIRKWTRSTCAYELKLISGREYLFVEWKSGDYIYGGMDTNYYVFERVL